MVRTVVVFFGLTACAYDARFGDCIIQCVDSSGCPEDLFCGGEGLCRMPGVISTCAALSQDADADVNQDGSPDARIPLSSCDGLAATCGSSGSDDCCSIAQVIPAGTFYRSNDAGSDAMYTSTSYSATVSSFKLDAYEVTVGRFRQFMIAGKGTQANPPPSGAGARMLNGATGQGGWDPAWNTKLKADTTVLVTALKCDLYQSWTDTPGDNESLPINCINWYEAFAFCAWDGGFLPTETEWNYAAVGGSEQRAYPWSSPPSSLAIDCSYANHFDGTMRCVNPPNGSVSRVGSLSPKGDGRWGQEDLAGNVAEWALDQYQTPYVTPCADCAELTAAPSRIYRGGGFYSPAVTLRGARRDANTANSRSGVVGVRCARAP